VSTRLRVTSPALTSCDTARAAVSLVTPRPAAISRTPTATAHPWSVRWELSAKCCSAVQATGPTRRRQGRLSAAMTSAGPCGAPFRLVSTALPARWFWFTTSSRSELVSHLVGVVPSPLSRRTCNRRLPGAPSPLSPRLRIGSWALLLRGDLAVSSTWRSGRHRTAVAGGIRVLHPLGPRWLICY
jgi:hypothetical protein